MRWLKVLWNVISSESVMEPLIIILVGYALQVYQRNRKYQIIADTTIDIVDYIEEHYKEWGIKGDQKMEKFIEQLTTMYPGEKPKVIMLSAVAQQDIIKSLSNLGVDYYLLKPIDATTLINRIKQATGLDSVQTYRSQGPALRESGKDIEAHVAKLLFELRMPTYFKGYSYLKDAICMAVEDSHVYAPTTVDLYERIAERHKTTPPVVEAAIRYTIGKTWKRGDTEQLNKLFGAFSDLNDKRVPTNSLFITRAAEEIKVNSLY
jgi:two-component system response regulator (stage 0 sporulation protein A)